MKLLLKISVLLVFALFVSGCVQKSHPELPSFPLVSDEALTENILYKTNVSYPSPPDFPTADESISSQTNNIVNETSNENYLELLSLLNQKQEISSYNVSYYFFTGGHGGSGTVYYNFSVIHGEANYSNYTTVLWFFPDNSSTETSLVKPDEINLTEKDIRRKVKQEILNRDESSRNPVEKYATGDLTCYGINEPYSSNKPSFGICFSGNNIIYYRLFRLFDRIVTWKITGLYYYDETYLEDKIAGRI